MCLGAGRDGAGRCGACVGAAKPTSCCQVRVLAGSVCECGEPDRVVAEHAPAAPDACAFETTYS